MKGDPAAVMQWAAGQWVREEGSQGETAQDQWSVEVNGRAKKEPGRDRARPVER